LRNAIAHLFQRQKSLQVKQKSKIKIMQPEQAKSTDKTITNRDTQNM